jgi:hypothetical protein
MKVTNKYYVGAEHIGNAIVRGEIPHLCHPSLDDAIADARKKLAADNRRDGVVIVKIVAVVKRQEPPVVVEEVE